MRIAIVGLGIMGASMARALKANTEHMVDGWNRTRSVLDAALEKKYIDGEATDFTSYDVVFVALPPEATIQFLTTQAFRHDAVVADICGMKQPIEDAVYAGDHFYRYVGTHPMAGKEKGGMENSDETLFQGANVIFTQNRFTDEGAIKLLATLYQQMGCQRFLLCTAKYHDQKIAYTSQLPHVLSNAFIKSNTIQGCIGFTGGSFQDMTRVAAVDEDVWTQLFFMNEKNLTKELELLISNLNEYLAALKDGDADKMKALLQEGNKIRCGLNSELSKNE